MRNALSIDVEEHFQVHNFQDVVRRAEWGRYPSRVVENTRRILRLLAERDVHATFFVLGWVADRQPHLVREIRDGGHDVATHGYWHELIYRQTPEEFAADLGQSLDAIERACGIRPTGYRAPCFSITRESLWAVDILRDLGIQYDSSIFPPVAHDRYGLKGASRFANRLPNGIWELPVSTVRLARRNWAIAGGGYFRLYPLWATRRAIRHLNAQGHPALVYLHPWEFDPEQPRIPGASRLSRFRHYVNLDKTEDRLRALLREFDFGAMSEAFAPMVEKVDVNREPVSSTRPEPSRAARAPDRRSMT
jgi:polysaccharide deacetylase family protein (PEP-CTERM system associated)